MIKVLVAETEDFRQQTKSCRILSSVYQLVHLFSSQLMLKKVVTQDT